MRGRRGVAWSPSGSSSSTSCDNSANSCNYAIRARTVERGDEEANKAGGEGVAGISEKCETGRATLVGGGEMPIGM